MSDRPPLKALPQEVEPRKFAQRGVELRGSVPVNKLPRLHDSVVTIGTVEAELQFGLDEQHLKIVTGKAVAVVERQCQRCLNSMEQQVVSEINLAIVWDDEQAKQLSQYDPWVVGEEAADLYGIIEEEILLNMPYVCYHEHMCVPAEALSVGDIEEQDLAAEKSNPFELLKQLKDLKKT